MGTRVRSHLLHRRQFLGALAAVGLFPTGSWAQAPHAHGSSSELATAWDDPSGKHFIGILQLEAAHVKVAACIEVPTRAHGLTYLSDGSIAAVARRPGEWLLRWHPHTQVMRWQWLTDKHRLNGHVLFAPEHNALYCTETNTEDDSGSLSQRNLQTLQTEQRWATAGRDPHDIKRWGKHQAFIANGGIATQAETGRAPLDIEHMDSSLVLLDLRSGAIEQQWRLSEPFLSIRHLSTHAQGLIGCALQAKKGLQTAPLLAVLDIEKNKFTLAPGGGSTHGYGADITALPHAWALSCPKDDSVLLYNLDGSNMQRLQLSSACALALEPDGRSVWAVGKDQLLALTTQQPAQLPHGLQIDNHAVMRV